MRVMFASNAKTVVAVTLVAYVASCVAVEQASIEDLTETRATAEDSISIKNHTGNHVETLHDEERGLPIVVETITKLFKPKDLDFDPGTYNRISGVNYLGTADYQSFEGKMSSKNPKDPLGETLRQMRQGFDDVTVAEIVVRGEHFPETEEKARHLAQRLRHQYIEEEKSSGEVFKLLEIEKSESVNIALNGEFFNVWAEFVIEKARVLYDAIRAREYYAESVRLSVEKKRLQGLENEMKELEKQIQLLESPIGFDMKEFGLVNFQMELGRLVDTRLESNRLIDFHLKLNRLSEIQLKLKHLFDIRLKLHRFNTEKELFKVALNLQGEKLKYFSFAEKHAFQTMRSILEGRYDSESVNARLSKLRDELDEVV